MSIYKDHKGWIWIGTWEGGVYLYLPHQDGQHSKGRFKNISLGESVGGKYVWRVFEDSRGIYWVATHGGGLYAFELPAHASNQQIAPDWEPIIHNFTHDPLSATCLTNDFVVDILEDENNNIWVSTFDGLNLLL